MLADHPHVDPTPKGLYVVALCTEDDFEVCCYINGPPSGGDPIDRLSILREAVPSLAGDIDAGRVTIDEDFKIRREGDLGWYTVNELGVFNRRSG